MPERTGVNYEAEALKAHLAGDYRRAMGLWESACQQGVKDKAARAMCRFMKDWEYFCAALVEGESMEIEGTLRDFLMPDFIVLQRDMEGAEEWSSWREFEAPLRLLQACLWWGYYDGPIVQAATVPLNRFLTRKEGWLALSHECWRQVLSAIVFFGKNDFTAARDCLEAVMSDAIRPRVCTGEQATVLLTLARWNKDGGFTQRATEAYRQCLALPFGRIQMVQAVAKRELDAIKLSGC